MIVDSLTSYTQVLAQHHWLFFLALPALILAGAFLFVLVGLSPFFAIALALLVLAVYLALIYPRILLCALLILRMSLDYSSEYISIALSANRTATLSQLVGAGVFVVGTIFLLRHRRALKSLPLIIPMAVLLGFTAVTLIYSIDQEATLKEFVRMADLGLIFFIAHTVFRSPSQYRQLLGAILLSSAVPIAFGVYQYLGGMGLVDETIGVARIYGTFSHPNIFSLYLFILLPVVLISYLHLGGESWKRVAVVSLGALYLAILLLTFTRIALVSLFVALAVITVFWRRKLLIPLVVAALVVVMGSPPLRTRVTQTLHPMPGDSITWRLTLWDDTVTQVLGDERWWLGYGGDTFAAVAEHMRGERFGEYEAAHNDFIKFFVEGGLIGLAVYLFYLGALAHLLWKQYVAAHGERRRAAVFLVLLAVSSAMAVAGLSDNVYKNTPLQWIFLALLGASLAVYGHRSQSIGIAMASRIRTNIRTLTGRDSR
ncbi:MAG: O-antigen ligase family protein [Patescibacteria group bacterium]|nr:O-antigen ligase family protein [Patescibacteria group bacterium]